MLFYIRDINESKDFNSVIYIADFELDRTSVARIYLEKNKAIDY